MVSWRRGRWRGQKAVSSALDGHNPVTVSGGRSITGNRRREPALRHTRKTEDAQACRRLAHLPTHSYLYRSNDCASMMKFFSSPSRCA